MAETIQEIIVPYYKRHLYIDIENTQILNLVTRRQQTLLKKIPPKCTDVRRSLSLVWLGEVPVSVCLFHLRE